MSLSVSEHKTVTKGQKKIIAAVLAPMFVFMLFELLPSFRVDYLQSAEVEILAWLVTHPIIVGAVWVWVAASLHTKGLETLLLVFLGPIYGCYVVYRLAGNSGNGESDAR